MSEQVSDNVPVNGIADEHEHSGRAIRRRTVERGAAAPTHGRVILGLTEEGDISVRIPQRELQMVLEAGAPRATTHMLLREIQERLGDKGTERVLRMTLAAITPPAERGRHIDEISGMPPASDDEAARAAASVAARSERTRDALLKGALGTADTARRLHMTRQGITERIKRGDLLALRTGKTYRLPPWQFDEHSEDGVVPGLPAVLHALAASPLAQASWLTRPSPYLAGETPLAALRRGDVEMVVAEARAVGAAGW